MIRELYIKNIDNVDYIVKNDLFLDSSINITDDENFWIYGSINNLENFRGNLDLGRMPSDSNEIIIEGSKDDYYIGYQAQQLLEKDLYIQDFYTGDIDKDLKVKIVGIKYNKNTQDYNSTLYMSDDIINKISFGQNQAYSIVNILFLDKYRESNMYGGDFSLTYNPKVPYGEVYITSDLNYDCPKESCINQPLRVEVNNLYYKETLDLKVTKTYTKNNMNNLLGIND